MFNEKLTEMIKNIHKDYNGLFGSYKTRIMIENELGVKINHKRIERLMSINNLYSTYRPKRKHKYKKATPEYTKENVLNRNFQANNINQIWLTDITEIKVDTKKIFISTIYDTYDNYPVSCEISERNDSELVERTLNKALEKYNNISPLFHSDRGFQYTREAFRNKLNNLGFIQSMSRVSRCIDNGPMESFQGIMKDEIKLLYEYKNVDQFKEALNSYLNFYINIRPQRRFKGKTPGQIRAEALISKSVKTYPMLINYEVKKYWNKTKENTS